MKQLQTKVDKDNVSLVHPIPQITTGEYKVTQVSFDFSEEWNDKIKKARFGDIEVDIINDTCVFPMFLKTGTIPIKVYGYDEEVVDGETVKVLVYSPQPALIHIEQGSYDGTGGGSSPTPPPEEDADYLTKSRLWSGYSVFFATLEDVPQDIQDEFSGVDISELTTAQVESEIEKINKMLLDAQAVKYITVDTRQSDIKKDLVNSIVTVRTNGSLAGSGSVKISATGVTSYIEVYKNTFIGLGTPMRTERLQIYANRIVYGKGTGGGISDEKTVYFPGVDTQSVEKFALLSDIPDALDLLDDWAYPGQTVSDIINDIYDTFYSSTDELYDITDSLSVAIAEKADASDIPDVSNFITSSVNNLVNYYKKSETYTQTEINALINALTTLDIQVVQALPTEDISTTSIYLLPKSTIEIGNVYDEYIYVSNSWEKIGSTEIDFSNYYTKTQADGKFVDVSSEQVITGKKKWTVDNIHTLVVDKGTSADGGYVVANKLTSNPSKPIFSTYYKSGKIINDGKELTIPSAENSTLATVDYIKSQRGKMRVVPPEKTYYCGTDGKIIDVTSSLSYFGNYYIDSTGNPVADGSNYCYALDLSQFASVSIKTATRSTSWYSYAFYTSGNNFISGGKLSNGSNNNQNVWNFETVNISDIPANAVKMLVVRYTATDNATHNFFVKGKVKKSVVDCFDKWLTDEAPCAVIYKHAEAPTKIYRVGSGRTPSTTEFTTLIGAVAQWVTDGKPCATIFVDSGVYVTQNDPTGPSNPLTINGGENRLTIIGEDKDATIVKSTTGKYIHPAINVEGGNVTIKNITFIADHSDNSSFAYLDPDREANGKQPNSAYAVHCDGGDSVNIVSGVIEFENCNMWSWQSCGLGCGTVVNGHVVVKNCDIRSFVPGTATDEGSTAQDATAEQKEAHALYVHGTRGAIVYHMSPKTKDGGNITIGSSNESFTLINSNIYLKGGTKTVNVLNNSETDFFSLVTFIDNTFWNDTENCNLVPVPTGTTNVHLGGLSGGNNVATVNSNGSDYSLLIK